MFKTLWPIFFAYLISQFGNWAFRAGFVYALYDKSGGSNSVLGWTIVLVYVPILLSARFLAPLSDRFNSKLTLISVNLARIILLVPILYISDLSSNYTVILSLILIGVLSLGTPIFAASQSVYIKKNVEERNVTPALAIIANIEWFSTIFGTICGPLILLYLNVSNVITINIATLFLSIIMFLIFLKKEEYYKFDKENKQNVVNFRVEFKKYKYILIAIFFLNLGAGVINLYPNFISRDIYSVGEIGLSYVYLANGIGGLLGALIIVQVRKKFDLVNIALVAGLLITVSLFTMSILTNFYLSLISSSFMLLFGQLFGVGIHAFLLKKTNINFAGKVTGLFQYATFSGVALNAVIYATLLSNANNQAVFWFMIFCSICALLASLLLALFIKKSIKNTQDITKSKQIS